jgi:hypothetical protein
VSNLIPECQLNKQHAADQSQEAFQRYHFVLLSGGGEYFSSRKSIVADPASQRNGPRLQRR